MLKVSGGWSAVVEKYKLSILSRPARMDALKNMVNDNREEWLKRLGIDSKQVEREVQTLVDYNVQSISQANTLAQELAEDAGPSENVFEKTTLKRRFTWMKHLHLLERRDDGHWSYNSLLKRLLKERNSK